MWICISQNCEGFRMIKWDIMTALDVCVDLILTGDTTPVFGQTEKLIDDYDALMGGSCAIFAAQCAKLG